MQFENFSRAYSFSIIIYNTCTHMVCKCSSTIDTFCTQERRESCSNGRYHHIV